LNWNPIRSMKRGLSSPTLMALRAIRLAPRECARGLSRYLQEWKHLSRLSSELSGHETEPSFTGLLARTSWVLGTDSFNAYGRVKPGDTILVPQACIRTIATAQRRRTRPGFQRYLLPDGQRYGRAPDRDPQGAGDEAIFDGDGAYNCSMCGRQLQLLPGLTIGTQNSPQGGLRILPVRSA
jgi:hypothetical protein